MTQQDLEQKLCTALNHAAPNDLQSVLSRCNERKGIVIPMTKNKSRSSLRIAALTAACFALVVAGGALYHHHQISTVSSIVSLDVNPSIQLTLNQKSRVLGATSLNQEAEAVLEGMDLKGTSLEVAVNAVVGSLLKHGYVNELANSILITVENNNSTRAAQLQKELTDTVNTLMQASAVNGAILSQIVTQDQQLQTLADQYGISLGKARLIQQLMEQNPNFSFAVLAEKTVNDLNLLLSSQANPLNSITATGHATDSGYIGTETAKRLAFSHAGVADNEASVTEIEFDLEDNRMVYEVDFLTDGAVYKYDVDAVTGEILKVEKEDTSGSHPTASVIDASDVKRIAFEQFAVTEDQIEGLTVIPQYENGTLLYQVKFWQGNVEYSCQINSSGQVLESEKQEHTANTAPSAQVGMQAAKQTALNHASLNESQVTGLRVKLDWEDDQRIYEVSFWQGNTEYDYKINADGSIREFEKETHTAPSVSLPAGIDFDDLDELSDLKKLFDKDDLKKLKDLAPKDFENFEDFEDFEDLEDLEDLEAFIKSYKSHSNSN